MGGIPVTTRPEHQGKGNNVSCQRVVRGKGGFRELFNNVELSRRLLYFIHVFVLSLNIRGLDGESVVVFASGGGKVVAGSRYTVHIV